MNIRGETNRGGLRGIRFIETIIPNGRELNREIFSDLAIGVSDDQGGVYIIGINRKAIKPRETKGLRESMIIVDHGG